MFGSSTLCLILFIIIGWHSKKGDEGFYGSKSEHGKKGDDKEFKEYGSKKGH